MPFRATLGDDDRPISIEFPEGTPVPLEQEVSGQVRLQQFRRSADDPEAPVEGTFVFERDGTPLRSAE